MMRTTRCPITFRRRSTTIAAYVPVGDTPQRSGLFFLAALVVYYIAQTVLKSPTPHSVPYEQLLATIWRFDESTVVVDHEEHRPRAEQG
jgi:hypothetical protein